MRTIAKPDYRKFYALLKRMQGAEKEELVLQYTSGRTTSLREMQPAEYYNLLGAMEAEAQGVDSGKLAQLDKARKRVIACISGYLKAMGKPNDLATVKAVACRASEYKTFNAIPLDRLNSLYNAFNKRQNDLKAANEVDLTSSAEVLQERLDKAVADENFELAGKLKNRIEELKKQ